MGAYIEWLGARIMWINEIKENYYSIGLDISVEVSKPGNIHFKVYGPVPVNADCYTTRPIEFDFYASETWTFLRTGGVSISRVLSPGEYKICVVAEADNRKEKIVTFKIMKITDIKIKVEPTEVYVGEEVKVTAVLHGTPKSSYKVKLYVNDNEIADKYVTLSDYGDAYVTFTLKFKDSGKYNICICCTDSQSVGG